MPDFFDQPGIITLQNQPVDPRGKYEYKAILARSDYDREKWVLKIVGLYPSGISMTPGQWYLDTLLGFDNTGGRISDKIFIDYGAGWAVTNMLAVLKEAEEIIYGTEELQESLNEGAVKDLLLRGPGKEAFIIWAEQHYPFEMEDLYQYAKDNELGIRELKTLAELYMEDSSDEEIEMLSDLVMTIIEREREEGLNEEVIVDERGRKTWKDPYSHIPYNLRNWYQKPENQEEYIKFSEEQKKEEKKRKAKAAKNRPEAKQKIWDLGMEIHSLEQEVKELHRSMDQFDMEKEEFSGWVISQYDDRVLDLLNSGLSDQEKIKEMEKWNVEQDRKDKVIPNPKQLLSEYKTFYPDEEEDISAQIELKEKEIELKEKELEELEDLYGY